jgi:methionyl-tRNA synthetase
MKTMYLTTPIYYVNDVPHIGHAYCTLATDILARFWRTQLGAENVFFLTGIDENSQKTVDAAKKANLLIDKYLDGMAANWRGTWEKIGISFDDFIRTTEPRHKKTVQSILQKIHDKGDIYKAKYSGKYCTGCETFLKEQDLDENGNCPDHKTKPQILEEENYFFRLSKYEKPLLKLFENKDFLKPEKARNEILNFIKGGLEDISLSRETAEFGLELPFDTSHKIYVWFDALINYFTAVDGNERAYFWPAEHIIGKDITRFHSVIWPAMLISAEIPPPLSVFSHGFFTIDGVKMSKSLGNVVSPLDISKKYGNDALRLGLLSSFEFGNDGDFSLSNFDDFYRSKLAGGIGNLFNRVIVLCQKFRDGKSPQFDPEEKSKNENFKSFERNLTNKKIKLAIDDFFAVENEANKLLSDSELWKLVKTDPKKAEVVFSKIFVCLSILAKMAEVLAPETAPKMRKMIGDGEVVGKPEILFPSLI